MPKKLLEVIADEDMVDEIYLEEDGTYLHNIFYKDDPSVSLMSRERNDEP